MFTSCSRLEKIQTFQIFQLGIFAVDFDSLPFGIKWSKFHRKSVFDSKNKYFFYRLNIYLFVIRIKSQLNVFETAQNENPHR